jgi:hypothetical protein
VVFGEFDKLRRRRDRFDFEDLRVDVGRELLNPQFVESPLIGVSAGRKHWERPRMSPYQVREQVGKPSSLDPPSSPHFQ